MNKTLQQKLNALPKTRREKILHRANELIQQELSRQQARDSLKKQKG